VGMRTDIDARDHGLHAGPSRALRVSMALDGAVRKGLRTNAACHCRSGRDVR